MDQNINFNFEYNFDYLFDTENDEIITLLHDLHAKHKYTGDTHADINSPYWGFTSNTNWQLLYFDELYQFITKNDIFRESNPDYYKFENKFKKYTDIIHSSRDQLLTIHEKCFGTTLIPNKNRLMFVKHRLNTFMKFLFNDDDVNKFITNETDNTIEYDHPSLIHYIDVGDYSPDGLYMEGRYNKNIINNVLFQFSKQRNPNPRISVAKVINFNQMVNEPFGGITYNIIIECYQNDNFLYELFHLKSKRYDTPKTDVSHYYTTIITIIEKSTGEFMTYVDEDNDYINYFTPYYWKSETESPDDTENDISDDDIFDNDNN
jgi:hypothetical protein